MSDMETRKAEMKTWDVTKKDTYLLMHNGSLTLAIDAVVALGWSTDTRLYQLVDRKRGLLYVVDDEQNMGKIGTDRFVSAVPIVGKTYSINVNKTMQVSAGVKSVLGWKVGDKFKEVLDMRIHGIIIEKVKE